jgi:hypothetical protein
MNALIIEPEKTPRIVDIENDLKTLQAIVGGYIEIVYPFDDTVALVCHEEGKLISLPLNRSLEDYDIIAGTFIIVGLSEDDFCSLTPEQTEKYRQKYETPEAFIRIGRSIISMPIIPASDATSTDVDRAIRKQSDYER